MKTLLICIFVTSLAMIAPEALYGDDPGRLRIYISVDLEGIGGVGTDEMTDSSGGKDYEQARKLATEEVNTVIQAIHKHGPADIVVNDSHGDHQNLLIDELDESVVYIQGDDKPLGMVQGLDSTFDAAILLGCHARAGTQNAFLAHTGSSKILNLTLNDVDVGEIGLNAAYAGAMQVPVVLVAGDRAAVQEATDLFPTRGVITKEAVTQGSAALRSPSRVRESLLDATLQSIQNVDSFQPWDIGESVEVEVSYVDPIYTDIASGIPGTHRKDGRTIVYSATNMQTAYPLIRIMYKFIDI